MPSMRCAGARSFGRFDILVTNAPRLSKDIYPQLARFGVPRDAFDTVITSGDVTAQLIAKQPDTPLRRAASLTGRDIPKSRLMAIGDGLATDVKGAADNGFDAYFVVGGIHASEFEERNLYFQMRSLAQVQRKLTLSAHQRLPRQNTALCTNGRFEGPRRSNREAWSMPAVGRSRHST